MNDSKIRSEYRDKYHDFINKEIIPIANEKLLSNETIELLVYKNASSDIGINTPLIILKQKYSSRDEKTGVTTYMSRGVEYTSDERYPRAFGYERGSLTSDYMRTVQVSNQNSFFDFVAVCIDRDDKNFATKKELFKHLKGLIGDKRYINQRKAAFEPSKFPKMNIWRESEYYNFVDSEFKKKLFEDESKFTVVDGNKFLITDGGRIYLGKASEEELGNKIAITDMDFKLQFVRFRVEEHKKPYVYTSNSKYYKSITKEEVDASKIANNNPYFMFILRCLNKDKKVLEPVLQYGQPVQYKEFSQQELSTYFDGFISNDKYKNEYDITFVPVEVNPGVDESSKGKYVDFVKKEIKPKIKNVGMVSADDDSVLFSPYAVFTDAPSKSNAGIVFMPNSKLNSYKKKHGQEVYGISDNNPNFKFMQECLNRNSTESKWVKFTPTREEYAAGNYNNLYRYLEGLPFNQQCKEDYLNNFYLPGSSSDAVSTMLPQIGIGNALFGFWLYKVIFQPVYSCISNIISGLNHVSDEKNEERSSDEPSSSMTEVREQQLNKKGIKK